MSSEKAGVSVSTVFARHINHTRRVMPETTRLVEAAIESMGYRPNTLARSLKTASTKSVRHCDISDLEPLFQRHHAARSRPNAPGSALMVFLCRHARRSRAGTRRWSQSRMRQRRV